MKSELKFNNTNFSCYNTFFVLLMSYLPPKEVFSYGLLINKTAAQYSKSLIFWKHLKADPDFLLYAALKNEIFEFLFSQSFLNSLNLENILFKRKIFNEYIPVYIMQQAQLSTKIFYLKRAKLQKQDIEKKIKSQLLELKACSFGYLQFPSDELDHLSSFLEGKTDIQIKEREIKFIKLLALLKSIIYQHSCFTQEQRNPNLNYLNLFLKIIFWNEESLPKSNEERIEFEKMLFTRMIIQQKIELNWDKFQNGIPPLESPKSVNGLNLAIELGNMQLLLASKKYIDALSTLQFPMMVMLPNHSINGVFDEFLTEAVSSNREAVLQLLFELGIKISTHDIYTSQTALYMAFIREFSSLAMLILVHGGNVNAKNSGRSLLDTTCFLSSINLTGVLLIYTECHLKNISVANEESMIIKVAKSITDYINALIKKGEIENSLQGLELAFSRIDIIKKYHYIRLLKSLEWLRLILILRGSIQKIIDPNTLKVISELLIFAKAKATGSDLQTQSEEKLDLNYLKKISFFTNLTPTDLTQILHRGLFRTLSLQ